jgi:TATA-box binding protein (TBP) (component of TFIID and TFIIIB)
MDISKTTILTGICGGSLNTEIDLFQLFDKITLDNSILGAKFHGSSKGQITGKKDASFFNQITILTLSQETKKQVNVKLFANGYLHFSGIKTIKHAREALKLIYEKILIKIKGEETVNIIIKDGIIYNEEDYLLYSGKNTKKRFEIIRIYSYPDKKTGLSRIIAYRKYNDFIINGEICVLEEDFLVSKKYTNNKKKIYNKSFEEIGEYIYTPFSKRKNVVLKGKTTVKISDNTYSVIDNQKFVIGEIVKNIHNKTELPEYTDNSVRIKYKCLQKKIDISSIDIKIENLNAKFEIKTETPLDLKKLNNLLLDKYVYSYYNDSKTGYKGLTLKIYYDNNDKNILRNKNYKRKASFLIFKSGVFLLSGCINKKQIKSSKKDITDFLINNKELVLETPKISSCITDKTITIYDLI